MMTKSRKTRTRYLKILWFCWQGKVCIRYHIMMDTSIWRRRWSINMGLTLI